MSSLTFSLDLFERLLNARKTAQVEAIMATLPIVPPDEYQKSTVSVPPVESIRAHKHEIHERQGAARNLDSIIAPLGTFRRINSLNLSAFRALLVAGALRKRNP
jgi:hypothetical protein